MSAKPRIVGELIRSQGGVREKSSERKLFVFEAMPMFS